MVNKDFIKNKISLIRKYVKEIENIVVLSDKEILDDIRNLRALERSFQLLVDEIIDVNLHFIRELDLESPDDFQSSFEIIALEAKIFPYEFAIKVAPVVGLRNRLVHRYEKVDPEFFVNQVKKEYQDFIDFIEHIERYINKLKS